MSPRANPELGEEETARVVAVSDRSKRELKHLAISRSADAALDFRFSKARELQSARITARSVKTLCKLDAPQQTTGAPLQLWK